MVFCVTRGKSGVFKKIPHMGVGGPLLSPISTVLAAGPPLPPLSDWDLYWISRKTESRYITAPSGPIKGL